MTYTPNTLKKSLLLITALLTMVISGCVQLKTTPGYARSGDLVIVGLGGINRNAQGNQELKVSDLTATITDSNAVVHNLNVEVVFKAYGDYTSQLQEGITNGALSAIELEPFDGGYYAVVALTDPGRNPLPLSVGNATVSISSPTLDNLLKPTEGNLQNTPIEILAGTVPWDADALQQFYNYRAAATYFVVSPDDLTGIDSVAGASLVFDYTDDSPFVAEPMVVPSSHHPFVQVSYNVIDNGDGTGQIRAFILNPNGFTTKALRDTKAALLSELNVKLQTFNSPVDPEADKLNFTLNPSESFYIDLNGDPIPGLTPTMAHIVDL